MENILSSIKTLLGPGEDDDHFDPDIIMHINSAFTVLTDIGLGPPSGFFIIDDEAKWTDFIGERKDLESVKTYVYLKTKLVFDPPQAGYLIDSIKSQIQELEWRLNDKAERSAT